MARPYRPEELERLLRLWRDAGGGCRTTLPVTDAMAGAAFGKLGRGSWQRAFGRPLRRAARVETGPAGVSSAVYARSDPDLSYIVPFARAAPAAAEVESMLSAAEAGFAALGARQYRVEAPAARSDLSRVLLRRGTTLWNRSVYRWPADAGPTDRPGPGVGPLARADRHELASLAERRLPHGRPGPAPIPFLYARAPTLVPFAESTGTNAWVLSSGSRGVGVAGATRFLSGNSGEVGPLLPDPDMPRRSVAELPSAPLGGLRSLGVPAVRASVPQGFEREERVLHDAGFLPLSESAVVEVALG